jgi:DNA cross-link repair 1A protein
MVLHPAIARAKIDTCYLDTTYLNPKYCFPPQPQVIEACANLARKQVLGISGTAPPLIDNKDDVKPDLHAAKLEEQERSKEMMEGWLVKKEDMVDVKLEGGAVDGDGDVKEELREVKPKAKGRTLVVMGTYSIGKERIVKGEFVQDGSVAVELTEKRWPEYWARQYTVIPERRVFSSARPIPNYTQ